MARAEIEMQCRWRWPAGGARGCSRGVRHRADAALTEGELAGAACGGAHGFGEIGGEAARSVGSVLGLGTKWGAVRDRGAVPLAVVCEREGRSLGVRQRADAALAEGEIVGAACSSVRDCDEIDGEAA